MAVTRADLLTQTAKQQDFYSDFLNSFAKSPFGNQIGKVTNNQSINQSLKNIILTQVGERPFQPYLGSHIGNILFDQAIGSGLDIQFLVRNAIVNNEKRVEVLDVIATQEGNSLSVTIIYRPINSMETQTFNFILKRVR